MLSICKRESSAVIEPHPHTKEAYFIYFLAHMNSYTSMGFVGGERIYMYVWYLCMICMLCMTKKEGIQL